MRTYSVVPIFALSSWVLAYSSHAQFFGSSPQHDIKQGAEVARLVERQMGLCSFPVTEAYVRAVGQRLVAAADDPRWKFSFQIVDQPEPNSFAIPGGGIYVSRGLLALLEREDELACVLGHEIAHVTQRHSSLRQRKGFLPELLSLPGHVVGSVVSENLGALVNVPIDTVGGAWLSHYSRGQETEADRIGMRMAAKAGYQPISKKCVHAPESIRSQRETPPSATLRPSWLPTATDPVARRFTCISSG